MKKQQVKIPKSELPKYVAENMKKKDVEMQFIVVDIPKLFRGITPLSKKDDPLTLFYKWLGDIMGQKWYAEDSRKTVEVTEVYMSSYDMKFLEERVEKFVAKRYPEYNEKRQKQMASFHWLQFGPSGALSDVVPKGKIYLGKKWLIDK